MEKTIDVTVRTEKTTPAVKAIKFASVGETNITYNESGEMTGAGSAVGTAVALTVDSSTEEVALSIAEVVTTDAAADMEAYQAVEWSLIKNGGTAAQAEGVTIDKEEGTLKIPATAAGDTNRELLLKVTATSKEKGLDGDSVKADIYIKLTFVPEVTDITIEGPGKIELGSDGRNTKGAVYKAKLVGTHLTEADQKAIEWGAEGLGADSKTTLTLTTAGDGREVTVTFEEDASTLEGDKTLVAKTNIADLDSQISADWPVVIKKNKTDSAPAIKLGETAGVTSGTLGSTEDEESPTTKITVNANSVRIPLSVELDDDVTRDWTYKVYESTGTTELSAGTDDNLKNITIEKNGTRSWLKIGSALKELKDEVLDEEGNVSTPATQIVLKATAAPSGATAGMTAKDLKFALVVEKSVEGVKLYQKKAADGEDLDGTPDTEGTRNISLNKSAGEQKVYLQAGLEGNHIPATEAANVTYKITNKSRDLAATCTKAQGDNAATVTIPKEGVGFVEVTATYKEGTGDTATVKTAKRLIKITDPSAVTSIAVSELGKNAASITIGADYDATADFTQTYLVKKGVENIDDVSWSVNATGKIADYVSIGKTTGVLTLNAKPTGINYLPAGIYSVTVWASYEEEGIPYQRSQRVTITVKKVAKNINVTGATGTTDLIDTEMADGTGDNEGSKVIVLTNATAGILTISAELVGDRFETADAKKLQYKVTAGDSGITPVALTDVTNGSVEITIPDNLTATKSFTVTFSVKEGGDLVDAAAPVTADVVVTVAAAD